MDEKNKAVETNNQTAATGNGVETGDQNALTGDGIDYAAELTALLEENARIARDRDNYRAGLLNAKGKDDGVASHDGGASGDDTDAIAQKVIDKVLPALQRTTSQDTISSVLNELSSDPNEHKLIMYHFDNSVASSGTLRERLENAKLIANKKTILKANKELKVALQNRSQMGNTSQGASTEDAGQVQNTFFTPEQLAYFAKRKLDPEKVKANILRKKNN